MPADDTRRRRKSTRRRRTDTSTSHTGLNSHEASAPLEAEPLERPATVEALRKARLTYLATPHDERRSKMKYEYSKTVKVKEEVKKNSTKNGSTVSKARSGTKVLDQPHRSRSRKSSEAKQETEESQYVYGPARTRNHVPGAFESVHSSSPEARAEKSRKTSVSTKVPRHGTERRSTEPVVRQTSRVIPDSTPNVPRPRLQRSTTAVPDRHRTIPRRSSTPTIPGSMDWKAASEVATTLTTSGTAKRSSSIFGGLFSSKRPPIKRKVSCLTCGDDVLIAKTAKLPCTHQMCHSCLERIFKLSVTDPAHMPPRCCTDQAISLKHVDTLFEDDFKETYNRKLKEYKTKNKIYCPVRGCGEWIQPKFIKMDKGRKIGRCPTCKTYVCGICSQKMHKTRDCPKDPATKEFVETAKKAGWQKCYECNAMVELKEGCNHMTCRCTAEFCMVCGLKWKSCDCPWFSYDQVDANGDPVRYQQEMDRRREQEQRDEAIARRMATLQLDDERPVHVEWLNLNNRNRNFDQRVAGNLPGDNYVQEQPAMPGGWDDGPQQFEEIPRFPRRRQQNGFDPAAADPGQPEAVGAERPPVVRHRVHRRRGTAPTQGLFEGRSLTAEEREQERQIRAWVTGVPWQ